MWLDWSINKETANAVWLYVFWCQFNFLLTFKRFTNMKYEWIINQGGVKNLVSLVITKVQIKIIRNLDTFSNWGEKDKEDKMVDCSIWAMFIKT